MSCLDQARLLAYLGGAASAAEEAHLEGCAACQASLADLIPRYETIRPEELRLAAQEPAYSLEEVEQAVAAVQSLRPASAPPAAPVEVPSNMPTNRTPKRLGSYQLLRTLGEPSGMGVVWLARHVERRYLCAVKVLRDDRVGRDGVARFRREIQAIRSLDHPHIVRVLDAGEDQGVLYLVMEYLDGRSLHQLVKQTGPLGVADACELVRQAALGLHHAHRKHLVHRDIKPGNLMLDRTARLKVLDFGLVTPLVADGPDEPLTEPNQPMGTWDYIAPEQIRNPHAVDIRADLYALGGTLFYLLTGRPPYDKEEYPSPWELLRAHQEAPVPSVQNRRPEVPDALAALIEKRLLAKNPDQRLATPAELAADLVPFSSTCGLPALIGEALGSDLETVPPPEEAAMQGPIMLTTPLHASLDILFWDGQQRRKRSIAEPGALPVRTGTLFQIESRLNRPACLYLIWISSEGKVGPVYPWEPGSAWDLRRPGERTACLLLPAHDPAHGYGPWPITGPLGVETLVLMVREEPLSPDELVKLPGRLPACFPRLEPLPDRGTAHWFTCRPEDWQAATVGEMRGFDPQIQMLADPVFQIDSLLRDKLGAHFGLIRAVSFTNLGPQGE
jgi:serine/threonine protein kinase